jgi:hypothetical protein
VVSLAAAEKLDEGASVGVVIEDEAGGDGSAVDLEVAIGK